MGLKRVTSRSALVFGGAGFIGSNWAQFLLENSEAKVHVFDNLSREGSRHNLEFLQTLAGRSGRLEVTIGDIRDRAEVERAARSATEIYHFAAQVAVTKSVEDPRLDFDINVGGTFNILEAARNSGKSPFLLFTSTNKVYGDLGDNSAIPKPTRYVTRRSSIGTSETQPLDFHSPYGCSKGAADQYVRDYSRIYGLPTVVFRMSCIAGPRQFGNEDQGWVAHFLYSALLGNPITIYGTGLQVRDVLHVYDLVRAFDAVQASRANPRGQVYNVGGGPANTVSLVELMSIIRELTGAELRYDREELRPGDQLEYVSDYSKLTSDTGWRPRLNVRDVLRSLLAWFQANRRLFSESRVATISRHVASLETGLERIA